MSAYSFCQPVLRQIRGGVIANEFCEEHQTSPLRPWLDPKNWPQVLLNLGVPSPLNGWLRTSRTLKKRAKEESPHLGFAAPQRRNRACPPQRSLARRRLLASGKA
jgi:hypothetical protein